MTSSSTSLRIRGLDQPIHDGLPCITIAAKADKSEEFIMALLTNAGLTPLVAVGKIPKLKRWLLYFQNMEQYEKAYHFNWPGNIGQVYAPHWLQISSPHFTPAVLSS
jgi:hypothetical protein